jgi:hypothetical protein
MPTDKEILDWMEKEGLESVIRCPQFNRDGSALGINLWKSHWLPDQVFVTMRQALIAGMEEASRDISDEVKL